MSDDPTTRLPDTEQGHITKPAVTAIPEPIAALNQHLSAWLAELRAEIAGLRSDIRRVEHKIELQNKAIGDLYTDQPETAERVDKQERKPS